MKTIPQMLKCFAAAMIFMSVTQAYAAGLISLHRFNETDTSQPAADSSGNGLNGTYQGGVTLSAGQFGNAIQLDGTSGYVSIPGNAKFDSSTLSLEFWMNMNGPNNSIVIPVARAGNDNKPWDVAIFPDAKLMWIYYTRFILLLAFWGTVGNSKLATRRGPPRGCDGPRRWFGGWRFSSSRSPDDTLRSDIASSPSANSVQSG